MDPSKINNSLHPAIVSTRTTLAAALNQLKAPKTGSGSSKSSVCSANGFNSINHSEVQELYQRYEVGELTAKKFKDTLAKDLNIQVSAAFEKVLADPTRNYRKVIKTFELPKKNVPTQEYYSTPKTKKFISSTSMTTLGACNNKEQIEEINRTMKLYSAGQLNTNEFYSFLRDKQIPVSQELERRIREHEETKSVPYYSFSKCVLGTVGSSPLRDSGNPQQEDPDRFRFVAHPTTVKTNPVSVYKSKKEIVAKEYDKVADGVYLTHKKKAQPQLQDNGDIVNWNSPAKEQASSKEKNQIHLEHHDIFGWARADIGSESVNRKKAALQRAAFSSGNILSWEARVDN